jgi:hypothetical protein
MNDCPAISIVAANTAANNALASWANDVAEQPSPASSVPLAREKWHCARWTCHPAQSGSPSRLAERLFMKIKSAAAAVQRTHFSNKTHLNWLRNINL